MVDDWKDKVNSIKIELLFGFILVAFVFGKIQQSSVELLLSFLLITIWIIATWYYYLQYKVKDTNNSIKTLEKENDIKLKVPEVATQNYYVKSAPKKGLKHLKENEKLVKIANNVIFVKTFDTQKYQNLLIYMDAYQKVYMYILAERYLPSSYVPTFLDLRENILETMYQFYIVVPKNFKHIYGVSPYDEIKTSIHDFLKLSRTMIEVLENFCRLDLKEHYFPTTLPMPHDEHNKEIKKHLLP